MPKSIQSQFGNNCAQNSVRDSFVGMEQMFQLGNFTDTAAGPWNISVNWGDGTSVDPNITTFSVAAAGALPDKAHSYSQPGNYSVTVTVSNSHHTAAVFFQVNVLNLHGTIIDGDNQSVTVGKKFPENLQISLTDAAGKKQSGVPVTFVVQPGANGAGASFSVGKQKLEQVIVFSKKGDVKAPTLTANTNPGSYAIEVFIQGARAPLTFTLTNLIGPASSIKFLLGADQSTTVGKAFSTPIVVEVADRFGNVIAGVPVVFAAAPVKGAGAVFQANHTAASFTVITDGDGRARVDNLVANPVAGKYQVSATSGAAKQKTPATNLPGPATNMDIKAGNNQIAAVNSYYNKTLQVLVQDTFGNGIANVPVTFTVPMSGPSGTIQSTTTKVMVTSGSGVAAAKLYANAITGSFAVSAAVPGSSLFVSFTETNMPGKTRRK